VNEVVSKRFRKKQQMQWPKEGAYLLLQTRVRVLNGELHAIFKQLVPRHGSEGRRDACRGITPRIYLLSPVYADAPSVIVGAPAPSLEAGGPALSSGDVPPNMAIPTSEGSMIERTPVSSEVEPQADLRQGDFLTLIATVNLTRKTGRIAYVLTVRPNLTLNRRLR
jgi:hypothetical protein